MITKQQALTANEFHQRACARRVGPRGGVTIIQTIWRRNGKTKTWKTRKDDWEVPIKYGLYTYGRLSNKTCYLEEWHVPEDCPLRASEEAKDQEGEATQERRRRS